MRKNYFILLLTLLCLSLCCAAPLYAKEQGKSDKQRKKENRQSFKKYKKLYKYLNNHHLDPIYGDELIDTAIRGTLDYTDPFSRYFDAKSATQVKTASSGYFVGIGIKTRFISDTLWVESLVEGAPAERAGVKLYDHIVAIDGGSIMGLDEHTISQMIVGKRGSGVRLAIARRGEAQMIELNVVRSSIPLKTIDSAYTIADGVGYIRINRFARSMYGEFRAAYSALGSPKSLILDLRDNPGGLLDQALRLSSFFLPSNSLVLSTRKGDNASPRELKIKRGADSLDLRVVVLINESSASASELVAGALQDWDRAVVVGRRSHGKGLMQRQLDFRDGSFAYIVYSEYLTPSGRAIQRPYQRGQIEQFRQSLTDRVKSDAADTIAGGDSLLYRTLRLGRRVYGGGGIYPDYHITLEPEKQSPFIHMILQKDLFNVFSLIYLRDNRERIMEQYPDLDSFLENYSIDQELVDELAIYSLFVNYALERSADLTAEGLAGLDKEIRQGIMRSLIYRLWGEDGVRKSEDGNDRDVVCALEILQEWEKGRCILIEGTKDEVE